MAFISRRTFIQAASVVSLAGHKLESIAAIHQGSELMLMGTQTSGTSKGIYAYRFDPVAGELRQLGLAAGSDTPSFLALAPNRKTVIAVNELEEYLGKKSGGVSSYLLDRATATLKAVNEVPSLGGAPCHVTTDHTGRCVFVANYSGGSVASYQLDVDGRLSEAVSFFQFMGRGIDRERQEAPHAHRVTVSPDNRFVLVNDLGLDLIHIFRLDARTAKITPHEPPAWKATPGSGPRALQFHPNGKWAYCVTEMASTVNVLHWDASSGTLQTIQELPMLPSDAKGNTAGDDIVLVKRGNFAYAANRLQDFLVTLSVSPSDGQLTILERSSCAGTLPRHLALDPSEKWLLVANQTSDNIAVFARDLNTGRLARDGRSFPLSRPQCILFA